MTRTVSATFKKSSKLSWWKYLGSGLCKYLGMGRKSMRWMSPEEVILTPKVEGGYAACD